MKKIAQILLLVVIGVSIASCSKIAENKLEGSYRVDRAFKNGSDYTQTFNALMANYKLLLADGGSYVVSYITLGVNQSESGTWNVSDKGKKVTLIPADTNKSTSVWTIIEHKKSSLKVQYTESGDIFEYHLLKD